MSPNEIPIPLEKTVVINGSTIEVSIAEKKMSDKEKASYQKFMAKCISESSAKTDKEAASACAVTFERMKEKIMAEDDLEEIKKALKWSIVKKLKLQPILLESSLLNKSTSGKGKKKTKTDWMNCAKPKRFGKTL